MTSESEIIITLADGRRVDALVLGHTVRTDQPVDEGGEDSAPAPFDLFLASIGTCAGSFVQAFCAKRGISYEGIRIIEHPSFGADGLLRSVALDIELPPSFPERYREALIRLTEQSSVKCAIAAAPVFTVRALRPPAVVAQALTVP